jgi:uncharacterized protein (TIGR02453 family)
VIDGPGFLGFAPDALDWFAGLEAQNEKPWFEANRKRWEAGIKAPLAALLDEAAARCGGAVKLFRIHRDVRFSADKSPYKTQTAGLIRWEGRPPLYAAISARGFLAGTGLPDPSKQQLDAFRAAIDDEETGPEFEAALAAAEARGVEVSGDAVATAPRGWTKDHPRIALLRRKQLLLLRRLPPAETLDGRRPFDFAMETWATLDPAMEWLSERVPL